MTVFFRQLILFSRAANAQCKSHLKMASMRRDAAMGWANRPGTGYTL